MALLVLGVTPACTSPTANCAADPPDPVDLVQGADGVATLDLSSRPAAPARPGCEFEETATLSAPDGQVWLPQGLSPTGSSVVVRYDLADAGGQDSGGGIGVASESGDIRWWRDPQDAPPGGSTWVATVSADWAVWGDGLDETDMFSLGAEFWAADLTSGEVRRVGETSRTSTGSWRTVSGYNRPAIVGDWLFWVDPLIGADDMVSDERVVGVNLADPGAPQVVAPHAYLTGVDECGDSSALVYADPGGFTPAGTPDGLVPGRGLQQDPAGGDVRVYRHDVGPDGATPLPQLVTTISRPANTVVTDLAVCGATVAWSLTAPVEMDSATGLEANQREHLWIEHDGRRIRVDGQQAESLRDLTASAGWIGFSDVSSSDGSATNYLYRLEDDVLLTAPTSAGIGQTFRIAGSHATWFEPKPGSESTDSFKDLQKVVVRLLPPDSSTAEG